MEVQSSVAINVLLDELCNAENNEKQLQSFKQINYISMALGEQRTINELLPFLQQLIESQEDQIMIGISECGLILIKEYYNVFQKKQSNQIGLFNYLSRLNIELMNQIYFQLIQTEDNLIVEQVQKDLKEIMMYVIQSGKGMKSELMKYSQQMQEGCLRFLIDKSTGEYFESIASKQTGLYMLGHLLSHYKQESNETIFKIIHTLTLHPSTNSIIAKYILDTLIFATHYHNENYQIHLSFIDSLILIANQLLISNFHILKIHFPSLITNLIPYLQNNLNYNKNIIEFIVNAIHLLTKENLQENLNEIKLQTYQIVKIFDLLFELSINLNLKLLKETILAKIIQVIELNNKQGQQQNNQQQQNNNNNNNNNNNINNNQNVIEQDEQGILSLVGVKINQIAKVVTNQKQNDHSEIIEILIKQVKVLIECENLNVKKEAACALMSMTYCFQSKKEIIDNVLPLFLQLLRDQNVEVKMKLLKKINPMSQKLGLEMLQQSIIPAICDLAYQKNNWRIKEKLVRMFIFYAKEIKTGVDLINSNQIKNIIYEFFSDQVYAVRDYVSANLPLLSLHMGQSWTELLIKNIIENQKDSSTYQFRITLIRALVVFYYYYIFLSSYHNFYIYHLILNHFRTQVLTNLSLEIVSFLKYYLFLNNIKKIMFLMSGIIQPNIQNLTKNLIFQTLNMKKQDLF